MVGCLVLLAGLASSCARRDPAQPSVAAASATEEGHLAVLPERAKVVAMADELAVRALSLGGEQAAALTRSAAQLRHRLWRLDHRETDGMEALELYRSLEQSGGAEGCGAAVDGALLRAEMHAGLTEAYRTVYIARSRAYATRAYRYVTGRDRSA